MPIGRLFFEIGGDTSRLNASLKEAIKTAEEAGVKITRAGQSFISKFDEALNPTRKLAEQINLLTAAGKSQADIWKVMSDEINRASEAAKKNGQAIDPAVKSIQEMNKAFLAGKVSFEGIGRAVGDFAAHPLESAKTGVSSFLGLLGPTAVGVGAVATGVVAAGAAIYSFAAEAADAAKQIQNLSYATGMTVERVQALQLAGKEKGLGDLTGTIEKLNAQLGGEGGPFSEAILRAGITPKAGADAIYYLEELRKHYAAISDPAERAQKATGELGRRLLDLLPIVLNDKESFADMVAEIERSNAVMKGPQMQILMDLDEQIDRHGRAWEAVKLKAKEYAAEATLAFMKAVEAITESSGEIDSSAGDWAASAGNKDWSGSYGVFGKEPPKDTIAERVNEIAKADAIASGTTQELLGFTMQLYDLEKQFTEEKKKQNSLYEYDSRKILSLAQQIASTKELIKETNDLTALHQKQWKEAEEAQKKLQELNRETAKIQEEIDTKGHAALVPSQNEIDTYLKKFEKETLDRIKTYNEVEARLAKEMSTSRLDELKAQREILAVTVPLSESEREQMGLEKAHIDYMVRAEEIRVKYQQIRTELQAKLNKLAGDDPLRKSAEEDLARLGEKEREELERAGKLFSADVLKVHREEYQRMIQSVREGAGEIFDAIVSRGKGAFQTLEDWIEGIFLSRLKQLFQNLVASLFTGSFGLSNVLAGVIPSFGASSSSGSWGNVLGGAGDLAQAVGSGGIRIPGSPAAVSSGFSLPGLYGGFSQVAPLIGAFGGAQGLSGSLGGGMLGKISGGAAGFLLGELGSNIFTSLSAGTGLTAGLTGFGTALLSNPWTAIAGGGLLAVPALINLFKGKTTYEAGAKEIARDFGGIQVSDDQYKAFMDSIGVSESQGWGYRAQMNRSPAMIAQLSQLAAQQGKLEEFLKSFESAGKGTWGGIDMRPAVEQGAILGDWGALDKVFAQIMQTDKAFGSIAQILPDWTNTLLVTKQLHGANQDLFDSFKSLKESIQSAIKPAETMFQKFLSTGKITEEFSGTIREFGGDLAAFEKLSGLQQLNNYFDEMAQHFRDTGEILPDLGRMVEEYGGDLAALDRAAALPGLMQKSGFIGGISSGLSGLLQQFDPTRQLLSGGFGASVQTALLQAGLDPDRFAGLSQLIRTQQGWDQMSGQALSGGTISGEMLEALSTYGGTRGQKAVEMYGKGINTLTPDLLGQTQINMEQAFQQALRENMDYLAAVGRDTNAEIDSLTAQVEEQLGIVSDNITAAMNEAREGIVEVLNQILMAIYKSGGVSIEGTYGTAPPGATVASIEGLPSLEEGGIVLKTGAAIVHEGERFDGGKGFGQPVQIFIQNCYGYDDFVDRVRQAGMSLAARGMPLNAPGY